MVGNSCLRNSCCFVGGAIGAAAGIVGAIINVKLWKGKYSLPVKIGLVLVVTALSFAAYVLLASIFLAAIQGV
jgi:hypothetical protein